MACGVTTHIRNRRKLCLKHLGTDESIVPNIFLVPKKDGGQRPVINLKALNQFGQTEYFKMEGLHTVEQWFDQETG